MLTLRARVEHSRRPVQPYPPQLRPVLVVVVDSEHGDGGRLRMFSSRCRRFERFGFSSTAE